ncbi:ABC transporter permease [Mesomycoplasma conjunctivae]|uniref:ABC transporter permease n=1 Tax=Mesomycoplasma conjunctivae TaxID=45361 RepID=UPI003DA68FF2
MPWSYFIKRIFLALLTFIAIYVIVYLLIASFSPDPFSATLESSKKSDGSQAAKLAELHARYFFDRSPIVRLGIYTANMFKGDFGPIYKTGETNAIPNLFFSPLRYTILVSLPSFILSSIIGVTLGIVAAYRRDRLEDAAISGFSTFFVAIPSFVLAPFIVFIAIKLGLPFEFKDPATYGAAVTATSLIPPIFVFTITSIPGYVFLVRNQVITVLSSDYVLIAKSKGLSAVAIFFKYVFRNSSIPLVRVLLFSYVGLLSGSIILEQFFRIPGSSSILVGAAFEGEINISMFSIIFFTSLALIVNILGDMTYVVMDPRITFGAQSQTNYLAKFKHWRSRKLKEKKTNDTSRI